MGKPKRPLTSVEIAESLRLARDITKRVRMLTQVLKGAGVLGRATPRRPDLAADAADLGLLAFGVRDGLQKAWDSIRPRWTMSQIHEQITTQFEIAALRRYRPEHFGATKPVTEAWAVKDLQEGILMVVNDPLSPLPPRRSISAALVRTTLRAFERGPRRSISATDAEARKWPALRELFIKLGTQPSSHTALRRAHHRAPGHQRRRRKSGQS